MNIIEALKSGKDFKRKHWSFWYCKDKEYLSPHEIIQDDWEVKESDDSFKKHEKILRSIGFREVSLKKPDEKIPFDPTKPVQTINGYEVRILCTNLDNEYPLVAAIKKKNGIRETIESYTIDGKQCLDHDNYYHGYDLINIPEPKKIDIHVGGVYRYKCGCIGIYIRDIYVSFLTIDCNEKGIDNNNISDIVEHLGDIQDLNEYIKDKLK